MSGCRTGPRRALAALAVLLAALLLAGCQVSTAVTVRVGSAGSGTVTVAVTFDRAAVAAVGGVEGQLRTSDLAAEGWRQEVTSGPSGSTVVTLSHPFAQLSQVQGILDEVARDPSNGEPLFVLKVTRTRSLFRVTTTAAGHVDLRCGVSCFGDADLRRDFGSEVGVDPSTLEGSAGAAAAAQDLPFSLSLALPGQVSSSDSAAGPSALHWTATLGRSTAVAATTSALDGDRVAEVSAAGTLTVVAIAVIAIVFAVAARGERSRRRARRGRHRVPRR